MPSCNRVRQAARKGWCRNLKGDQHIPMRHAFVWVRVHLVWSTDRRQLWIDRAWQERLYRCLAGIARRKGAILLCAGGAPDHVHLYVSLGSRLSVANLVDALKANSSRRRPAIAPPVRVGRTKSDSRATSLVLVAVLLFPSA